MFSPYYTYMKCNLFNDLFSVLRSMLTHHKERHISTKLFPCIAPCPAGLHSSVAPISVTVISGHAMTSSHLLLALPLNVFGSVSSLGHFSNSPRIGWVSLFCDPPGPLIIRTYILCCDWHLTPLALSFSGQGLCLTQSSILSTQHPA
mgnify:CR=1 FL=1